MPIRAVITKEALNSADELNTHFIPASIDGNGSIKIDEYFNSYSSEESGVKKNSLRGYPLKGTSVDLPENIQGIVLREEEKLQVDNADRVLKFGGKFSSFTYWNYDKNPSKNDAYQKSLHWIKVSDALHSEIDSLDDEIPPTK